MTNTKNAPIYGFFGQYRFLSNFALVTIEHEGLCYKSTEHAYQASKTDVVSERLLVQTCNSCREARIMGRYLTLRPDWDLVKDDVMFIVNVKKYAYPEYAKLLLSTGNSYLEETNTWGDRYWGVCNGVGHNKLGKILMNIRQELQAGV